MSLNGVSCPVCYGRGLRFGGILVSVLMVDIGEDEAYVRDEVVLIGSQGNEKILLEEIATQCNTIPYEILCLLNNRIPRIYI